MTEKEHQSGHELETLLDAYGADMSRWPARVRARGAAISVGPQADRMLAEARALDRLLQLAPVPGPERHAALADRVLAAATGAAEQPAAKESSRGIVIPWPGAARGTRTRPVLTARAPVWRAVALLAASLALGIFVGALDMAPSAVDRVVEAAALGNDVEQSAAVINDDGLADALDENFL